MKALGKCLFFACSGIAGHPNTYSTTACRATGPVPFVLRRKSGLITCFLAVLLVENFGSSFWRLSDGATCPLRLLTLSYIGG
jgi:hypothetical protein